ncbi:MAG: phosphatase PAP2 family protein [Chloroflexota bacterium]|nr:phosphatase PAP2 family protein [Chloroflexota bacterium]
MRIIVTWDRELSARLTLPTEAVLLRRVATLGAHLGDSWLWLAASSVAWMVGDAAVRRLVLVVGLAVVFAVGVTMLLKILVRRRRPQERGGFYSQGTADRYSFPSGHAARVASIAVTLGLSSPLAAAIFYPWAVFVALCRVLLGLHYLGDILVGLGTGFIASCVLAAILS